MHGFFVKFVVPGGHGVYPEHEGEEEVNGEITHQDAGQGQQTQAYTQVPTCKSSVSSAAVITVDLGKYSGSTHNS